MKKRIITAAVLIPVLILVALVAPTIVAAVVWGLLLAVGVYELLYVTGLVRHLRMVLYSAVMAFAVSLWSLYGAERSVAMLGLLIFWILLFSDCNSIFDCVPVRRRRLLCGFHVRQA